MRVERRFWMVRDANGDPERATYYIYCEEESYCEDAACEAKHDDPSTKWDVRSNRILCEAYGRENAKLIVEALRSSAALVSDRCQHPSSERVGDMYEYCPDCGATRRRPGVEWHSCEGCKL